MKASKVYIGAGLIADIWYYHNYAREMSDIIGYQVVLSTKKAMSFM